MLDFDVFNMYPDKILVLQGEVFLLTKEKPKGDYEVFPYSQQMYYKVKKKLTDNTIFSLVRTIRVPVSKRFETIEFRQASDRFESGIKSRRYQLAIKDGLVFDWCVAHPGDTFTDFQKSVVEKFCTTE